MSSIAELRRRDNAICQALLTATREMQSLTIAIAALPDPRTAELKLEQEKLEQLQITCEAIQEYLVRHREKLHAASRAGQSVPEMSLSPTVAGPLTTTSAPALSAIQNSGQSVASAHSIPPLSPPRLDLQGTGSFPLADKPRLSLKPDPSKPYLTLSGNPPPRGALRLADHYPAK